MARNKAKGDVEKCLNSLLTKGIEMKYNWNTSLQW